MVWSRGPLLVLAAWLFLVPDSARAWAETGHMLVAQIAYQRLEPETRQEADRLIYELADLEPRIDHFVTSSVWMDRIKREGLDAFDRWHYVNLPFDGPEGAAASLPTGEHVVWAIERSRKTLSERPIHEGDFSKALMLRVLVHLVGDIHQPLHAASRVTPDLPEGDRGGNDFPLEESEHETLLACPGEPPPAKADRPNEGLDRPTEGLPPVPERRLNLHAFWDRGVFALPDTRWPADRNCIETLAREIHERYPPASLPHWTRDDPAEWARESHRLAVELAYEGLAPGEAPGPAYVREAQPVVLRRIAIAGYRLAALLETTLGNR